MLDYQAVSALFAVIETQHFQRAAEKLHITQSAVSQRIKSLETYYGEPVLVRTLPYRPTRLGAHLLDHLRRTMLLEEALNETLLSSDYKQRISVAVSRDSLETWFRVVIEALHTLMPVTIEMIADDQDLTLSYLENGLVSACASTEERSPSGCESIFLGYFDYVLVASPAFKKTYFSGKNFKDCLKKAPTIKFDQKDRLQEQYLKHFFSIHEPLQHCHVVPSVVGFRDFALNGYAYTMIPEMDIVSELRDGKLVNLAPDCVWHMPVYWHTWSVKTTLYKAFHEVVLRVGREVLRQE